MDIAWLEDYLALRDLGSFTAAAEKRNASQPAFSRRIQALEAWLGVTLVDRSSRPPSFTPLAVENDAEIRSLLYHFHDLRGRLRGEQTRSSRVRLAVQHSLSISLLPRLMGSQKGQDSHPVYWLYSGDWSVCAEMMLRGEVDLLICYETPHVRATVPTTLAARRVLGRDVMVLAGLRPAGEAGVGLEPGQRLPLLTYPQSNFFGQIIWDQMMPLLSSRYSVETVCVSGFSGALKQMALSGMGLAWLPQSLAQDELAAGVLATADPAQFSCELDISLYTRTANVSDAQASAWRALFGEKADSMRLSHK